MNTKEQTELLMGAIQQLMELYQDLSDKLPQLRLIIPEHGNDKSELKKIAVKLYLFLLRKNRKLA